MNKVIKKYEYSAILTGVLLTLGVLSSSKVSPPLHNKVSQETLDSLATKIPTNRVQTAQKTENGLCYVMDNGSKIERIGGTIAWRNNNPGCIRYSARMVELGAIGKADGFAVFPNEETGMRAIKSLLLSDAYCDLNISAAINKYAPPHENNTAHYINSLCGIVGVSRNTKICELNDEQMTSVVYAIRKLEGWITGVELRTPAPKPNYAPTEIRASIDHTMCHWMRRTKQHTL